MCACVWIAWVSCYLLFLRVYVWLNDCSSLGPPIDPHTRPVIRELPGHHAAGLTRQYYCLPTQSTHILLCMYLVSSSMCQVVHHLPLFDKKSPRLSLCFIFFSLLAPVHLAWTPYSTFDTHFDFNIHTGLSYHLVRVMGVLRGAPEHPPLPALFSCFHWGGCLPRKK